MTGIFRGMIWNETVPDRMRGRLAGSRCSHIGPDAGHRRAGFGAALVGLRASIVARGALCIGRLGALAAALPGLWRYDARTFHGAAAEPCACDFRAAV